MRVHLHVFVHDSETLYFFEIYLVTFWDGFLCSYLKYCIFKLFPI